ncbi:MAG: amidohydrolase family protein [Candidatus Latescibacterota bacterium]|nr:amidohydrolase family protein [Candidatus Latescibacterota bacterium]
MSQHTPSAQSPRLVDADAHNYTSSMDDLLPHLSKRWQAYVQQGGYKLSGVSLYPKIYAQAARRDAIPSEGGIAGSDPDFAREQLLDEWNIDLAILNPLIGVPQIKNPELAVAMMRAVNDWTASRWLDHDPRWRGSILIHPGFPEASAEEIRRWASDRRFVQTLLMARSSTPYGKRELDPIYKATSDAGLPIGIHFGGGGDVPITAVGWPSYYIEDHTGMVQAFEGHVISLVCEGTFAKFPDLRVVLIEGGFAWLPALMWRLDKNYRGLREEVPWLTRLPSEYIRDHFHTTTQPMEEPANPQHLMQIIDMIDQPEFLMFATDYPHWDFDAPDRAIPSLIKGEQREQIRWKNAAKLYRLA